MARKLDRTADGGFTMIEVLVALALISGLMAALGTYFVGTMKVSRYQAQIQTATRLLQTSMEQARGYGGGALLVGRAECGSCLDVTGYDNPEYLTGMVRWDAQGTDVTPTVPLTNNPQVDTINGIQYTRYTFVGKCWQAATGGACSTTSTLPVAMVRLVVGVTWTGSSCPYAFCIRASSALFSATPDDPVFTQ